MNWFRGLIVSVMVLSFAAASTLGCNTMKGVGRDVQKGGEAIEDAAE